MIDETLAALARLRRPPFIIIAISAFSVLAGFTFIARQDLGVHFQAAVGAVLISAGIGGLALIGIPSHRRKVARIGLSITGPCIVVGFALRGASLWQALIYDDLGDAWSYYLVGGAQWMALAYMTMVAWFDIALPWVLARSH